MGGVQVCQRRSRNASNQSPTQVATEEVQPLWSTDDAMELCAEGEERLFRGKLQLLDATKTSSVAAAVQTLNEGRIPCQEGFCVVHATTRGRYFLLWQRDMKRAALEKMGVDEEDLMTLARQRHKPVSPPRRQPPAVRQQAVKPIEFQIILDRTGGMPLGIDVQPEQGQLLFIDGISEDGLIASWNASNPNLRVKPGDRIVEVNGHRGSTESIIAECKQPHVLFMTILQSSQPHRAVLEESFGARFSSVHERRDASCNTGPMDQHEEPSGNEVHVPVMSDGEFTGRAASAGHSSNVDSDVERTEAADTRGRTVRAKEFSEYAIEIDRTDGSKLGVDVVPANDAELEATLLIEGVSEGLIKAWNDAHPDARVEVGDWIVEVNGIQGNLRLMIDQCKLDQALHLKLRRAAEPAKPVEPVELPPVSAEA